MQAPIPSRFHPTPRFYKGRGGAKLKSDSLQLRGATLGSRPWRFSRGSRDWRLAPGEPRVAVMPAAPEPADGWWGWGSGGEERAGPGAGLPGGGPGALREVAAPGPELQDSGRSVAGPPLAKARREDAVSAARAGTAGKRLRERRLEPALSSLTLLKFAMGPTPTPKAPLHPALR